MDESLVYLSMAESIPECSGKTFLLHSFGNSRKICLLEGSLATNNSGNCRETDKKSRIVKNAKNEISPFGADGTYDCTQIRAQLCGIGAPLAVAGEEPVGAELGSPAQCSGHQCGDVFGRQLLARCHVHGRHIARHGAAVVALIPQLGVRDGDVGHAGVGEQRAQREQTTKAGNAAAVDLVLSLLPKFTAHFFFHLRIHASKCVRSRWASSEL